MRTVRVRAFIAGLLVLIAFSGATVLLRRHKSLGSDSLQVPAESEAHSSTPREKSEDAARVPVEATPSGNAAAHLIRWERVERMMGERSKGTRFISDEEAERFLQEKGISALNLLAAAAATENDEFARRAAKAFPEHPVVQLTVLSKDLFPNDRAEWIARFKAAAPDNPLPFIYEALETFQQQDSTTALAQASSAIEKSGLYWWSTEFIQATQELYRSLGYTALEAELFSAFAQPMPHLKDFRKLNGDLLKWREQALQEGNLVGAEEALRTAYGLGRLFQSPEGSRTLINQVVGFGLEARALKAVPADVQPSFLDVPRAQKEAEMRQFLNFSREVMNDPSILLGKRDADLLASYLQHYRDDGEYQAMVWLKQKLK